MAVREESLNIPERVRYVSRLAGLGPRPFAAEALKVGRTEAAKPMWLSRRIMGKTPARAEDLRLIAELCADREYLTGHKSDDVLRFLVGLTDDLPANPHVNSVPPDSPKGGYKSGDVGLMRLIRALESGSQMLPTAA